MVVLENLVTAAFTVIALLLTVIAWRAWAHVRSRKVLLLASAFTLFFIKGAFLSFGLFWTSDWERSFFVPGLIVDLIALVLLYLAVFHRA